MISVALFTLIGFTWGLAAGCALGRRIQAKRSLQQARQLLNLP